MVHRVEVELEVGLLITKNTRLRDLIPIVKKRKSEGKGVVRCLPITPILIDMAFEISKDLGPISKIAITENINATTN